MKNILVKVSGLDHLLGPEFVLSNETYALLNGSSWLNAVQYGKGKLRQMCDVINCTEFQICMSDVIQFTTVKLN